MTDPDLPVGAAAALAAEASVLGPGIGPTKPQGGRPTRHREKQHIAERRAVVETWELAGASVREIARITKTALSTVDADLKAIRKARRDRLGVVDLEAERALELERLEQQRLWLNAQARRGSIGANRTLIRVSESKRKLLGLDAPERIAVSFDPYEAIRTGLDREALAALALRQPGDLIDLPDDAVVSDSDDDVDD